VGLEAAQARRQKRVELGGVQQPMTRRQRLRDLAVPVDDGSLTSAAGRRERTWRVDDESHRRTARAHHLPQHRLATLTILSDDEPLPVTYCGDDLRGRPSRLTAIRIARLHCRDVDMPVASLVVRVNAENHVRRAVVGA
jgi:hypothetical protein